MLFRKCAASAVGVSLFVAATVSTLVLPRTIKASPIQAGSFTITIAPDGAGNVVASGSGDVNINGASSSGLASDNAFMTPNLGSMCNGPATTTNLATYAFTTSLTGPKTFGSAGQKNASSGTGSMVEFDNFENFNVTEFQLCVPVGYTADTALTDSSTYTGATLSSLGLTPGTFTWTMGSGNTANTFKIIVNSTPAPEPASLSLLGLGSTMLLRRRRKI